MSDIGSARLRTAAVTETAPAHHYVDWAAALTGAFVACAIFVTLTSFGTAIGLTLTSPYPGSGFTGRTATWAVGIWEIWVAISAFAVGGYLAGRLRHRVHDATEHESDVRDSAHGLLVWALAALLGGWIISATARDIGHAANSSQSGGAPIAGKADPARYAADTLLRGNGAPTQGYNEPLHKEVASVLAAYATGANITPEDRAYLSRTAAATGGIPQAEADHRTDVAVAQVRQAANTARRSAVMLGFFTAVSLALAAAAAWSAAALGGRHRDEGTDASEMFRWR